MRREPITDAVLRAFTGSERELVKLPGYGVVCCSDMGGFGLDLARELLALRGAAKFAWGGLKDIEEGRDGPGEKWCAEACRNIEDLLPKEPA